MSNKQFNLIAAVLIAFCLLFAGFTAFSIARRNDDNDVQDNTSDPNNVADSNGTTGDGATKGNYEDALDGSATYLGDSLWEYTITGYLPTPCHSTDVDILIAESFPEQVTAIVTVNEPGPAETCIQSIQDVNITGKFSASEGASFKIQVK